MRDGVVSVAASGAHPSVSLLRSLKREFGFYCIELVVEEPIVPKQLEVAYVIGGCDNVERTVPTMERFDALSGQWSSVAPMYTARMDFGACLLAGDIFVSGGMDPFYVILSSVEKYSTSTDTWSAVSPLPEARHFHASVAVGLTKFVLGGFDNDRRTATTFKFDSALDTWSEVAPMPEALSTCAATAVGTDLYVFGGEGDDAHDPLRDCVFKYDTVADQWSTLAPMPIGDALLFANVIGDVVHVVGGWALGSRALRFESATGAWASRHFFGASFVLEGCLYSAGGDGVLRVERYDMASDTWTAVVDMLEGRSHHRAVTVGNITPAEERDLFDSLISKATRSN
jgi:hypothetical protein